MISPQLCSRLEERYSLGVIQKVYALTGGKRNTLLHLKCERGAVVLRISHPTSTSEAIAYEHKLMQFMSLRIPEVPAAIPAHNSSTYFDHDGLLMTLFPLMVGQILNRENETECISAAKMLLDLLIPFIEIE